ncbi:MAG: prolipoprotein diacylglyceryl transferase, partial [Thermoguttaceae bacterium]|nr:prolipoprotein diacylglyceryl transferase [Thermoguttaceae bacterium]
FDSSNENVDSQTKQRKIRRFRVENNAQVFYFFLNIWDPKSENNVVLTLMNEKEANNGDAPEKAASADMRNVVFHPEPVKSRPVHPTQIYSTFNMLIVCGLLLLLSRLAKRDGIVFAGLLILYPIHRFCIELLRTDEESFCGTGLTVSQCVSLATFAVGIAVLAYSLKGSPKRALEGYFPKEEENN